ncbi:MAG: polymerase delta prime subunit [Firmicutes bacterium]|nr:polymerase delta prime subunit [Bacillota bacterium]
MLLGECWWICTGDVMNWDSIAGQTDVLKTLKNLLTTQRVPHAMLFTGPNGVGKMLTARLFAAALLCEGTGIDGAPCGQCPACQKVFQDAHPDLVILASDKSSIKIDQIRALKHEASLVPYHGGLRVFILEAVDGLTTQAANSLLKILEEPPENVIFIMIAVSKHSLLPTVLSRCRVFAFHPLAFRPLTELLVKQGVRPELAAVLARLSGGSIGNALELAAPEGLAKRNRAVELVAAAQDKDMSLIWKTAASLDKLEPGELNSVFNYIGVIFRDIIMIKIGQHDLVFNLDLVDKLEDAAKIWTEVSLRQALNSVKEAGRALEANANYRLTFEALMIKLFDAVGEG